MKKELSELPGRRIWDLGYVLRHPFLPPIRKRWESELFCGSCASDELYFKGYSVFEHPLYPYQDEYRMDVAVKCGDCGHVQQYGIHISKNEYEQITTDLAYLGRTTRRVTWMDTLKLLGEHILVNEGIKGEVGKRVSEAIKDMERIREMSIL